MEVTHFSRPTHSLKNWKISTPDSFSFEPLFSDFRVILQGGFVLSNKAGEFLFTFFLLQGLRRNLLCFLLLLLCFFRIRRTVGGLKVLFQDVCVLPLLLELRVLPLLLPLAKVFSRYFRLLSVCPHLCPRVRGQPLLFGVRGQARELVLLGALSWFRLVCFHT